MADAVTPEIYNSGQEIPIDQSFSSRQLVFGRILGALTCFLMFLSIVFSFVKGREIPALYLLGINALLSSVIAAFLVWWYHKEVIPSSNYPFMIIIALCMIFQAIISDVYVWHKQKIPNN